MGWVAVYKDGRKLTETGKWTHSETTAVLGWFRGRDEQEVGRLEISEVISLIKQAKEGDRGAFEELMHAYSGFVYSLAFRMLGSRADAEDVFQETFFRAWSHLRSFRSGGNFTHWTKRIGSYFHQSLH